VRDPFDWLLSYWSHRTYVLKYWEPNRVPADKKCGALPFEEFVACIYQNFPNFVLNYFERFVGEEDDEIHFVGRLENIESDFIKLLDQISPYNTPRIEVKKLNERRNKETYEHIREFVYRKERKYCERFLYGA